MCLSKAVRVPLRVPRTMLTYRTTILTRFRSSRNRNRRECGPESKCEAIASKGWISLQGPFLVSLLPLLVLLSLLLDDDSADSDACIMVPEDAAAAAFFRSCNWWWLCRRNGSSSGKSVAHFPTLSRIDDPCIHGLARSISFMETNGLSASNGSNSEEQRFTTPLPVSSGRNRYHNSSRMFDLVVVVVVVVLLLVFGVLLFRRVVPVTASLVGNRSRTAVPYFFANLVASFRSPWWVPPYYGFE